MTDNQEAPLHTPPVNDTFIMATATAEMTISLPNGGAAAPVYVPTSGDTGNKRPSIGSVTFGLWELAVNSAIRFKSARKKGPQATSDTTTSTGPYLPQQRALPPLPAVPPVGPGGSRKPRPLALTRSQSLNSKLSPPSSASRPSPPHGAPLQKYSSMADLFSTMVAARLKPVAKVASSTHCLECNQRFSLIFRRHHCTMCQRSVCAYCSTYQRFPSDMEEENETNHEHFPPNGDDDESKERGWKGGEEEGDRGSALSDAENKLVYDSRSKESLNVQVTAVLQRVCRKCASELEGKQAVHSRTWTDEFISLRKVFKQGRQMGMALDNDNPLPPRIPRLPPVCERVARSFLEECKKNAKAKSLFRTTSESFNAGLQNALKPPTQRLCTSCSKLLRFSVERKSCTLCNEVFCRNCSSRDLALTMPEDLHPGDTQHEMSQVNVRILTKEEVQELDKNKHSNNSNSASTTTKIKEVGSGNQTGFTRQRYRVCDECRDHVMHVLQVMSFNDTLAQTQAELMDLQEQIAAVLDEQDNPSPGIGLTRWPSVRSFTTYTSEEDEVIGEAVNERVAGKLLERFFRVYLQLERLEPVTVTQGVLNKHVKQAMSSFYMLRRSQSSKRFSRRDTVSFFS